MSILILYIEEKDIFFQSKTMQFLFKFAALN